MGLEDGLVTIENHEGSRVQVDHGLAGHVIWHDVGCSDPTCFAVGSTRKHHLEPSVSSSEH